MAKEPSKRIKGGKKENKELIPWFKQNPGTFVANGTMGRGDYTYFISTNSSPPLQTLFGSFQSPNGTPIFTSTILQFSHFYGSPTPNWLHPQTIQY